jgi:tetratricopeptide (TPR) repeat protein
MNRPRSHVLSAALAAIAVGFAICAAADPSPSGDTSAAYAEARRLSESGHHLEAIPLLQKLVATTRAEFGMFDPRQQDMLQTLAASLTAVDRIAEAQDVMVYRVRIAEKQYGEAHLKVIPYLVDFGNWFADVGKTPEARMTFGVALNIVGAKDTLVAPILVEPLRGIARAYMLRMSYPQAWLYPPSSPGCSMVGNWHDCRQFRMDSTGKRIILPRELNQEGEEVLKRALQILDADPSAAPAQTRIETLIQLGDWYQIKESPREALPYYQRALELIRTTPDLPRSVTTALDAPLRVSYPTPQIVANVPKVLPAEARPHSVEIEFNVTADGSVKNARIVDHDTRDRYARDILDAVRESRFRPKFVDGQPVAAPGISYREVFWTGAPRT